MKHFNKLVEKDDYDKADKKYLIKQLFDLSSKSKKYVEEGMF